MEKQINKIPIDWNDIIVSICLTLCFIASCGSCTHSCLKDKNDKHELEMKKLELGCNQELK